MPFVFMLIFTSCSFEHERTVEYDTAITSIDSLFYLQDEEIKLDTVVLQKLDLDKPLKPNRVASKMPDFSSFVVIGQKKEAFFDYLRPVIEQENRAILKTRSFVEHCKQVILDSSIISIDHLVRLKDIAITYRMKGHEFDDMASFYELLLRVDIIPTELALVQAALESAWGTSKFCLEGNNLFGQWCFRTGCGQIPSARAEGATHEVAIFRNVSHSVKAYMKNLNSHPAYKNLRSERYKMRLKGKEPTGDSMAIGLTKYSALGMEYVEILQGMMRKNYDMMGI